MSAPLTARPIPDHVPPHLVYEYDLYNDPRLVHSPHTAIAKIRAETTRFFYTPLNGGHWFVTRAHDAIDILRQTDLFSSDPQYNWNLNRKPVTLPNQADPPLHGEYRRILNAVFSPGGIRKIEPGIRALARDLIDTHLSVGKTEFITDFAREFPVRIFLQMADAPFSDADLLLGFVDQFTRGANRDIRNDGLAKLSTYLITLLEHRKRNKGDDLLSLVAHATIDDPTTGPRSITDDERIGLASLLFLGGLDTVASTLSFTMNYLGRNPDQYARLTADRAFITHSVEELLRATGGAGMERGLTRDTEFHGIQLKKNDRISFSTYWFGYDDEYVNDPARVDLDREVSQHLIFGAGPHRCLGSHLARLEVRVFLEEWTRKIPHFSVQGETINRPGTVWLPERLDLAWA